MDRETILLNIMNNYGKHGVTRELINDLIDDGLKNDQNYDGIYLMLRMDLAKLTGEHEYATVDEMARVLDVSDDEMAQIIEDAKEELTAAGENPDDYFKQVPVSRFMM